MAKKKPTKIQVSPKQAELLAFADRPPTKLRMLAAQGTVRSGKTYGASLAFFRHTQRLGPLKGDVTHAVIGANFSTLKATIWQLLVEFSGDNYAWNGQERVLTIRGVKYKFLANTDVRSEHRLMGYTFHSVLYDEAVLTERDFYEKVLTRCSSKASKVWLLTNPGHPASWVKQEMDAGRFEQVLYFSFPDNADPEFDPVQYEADQRSKLSGAQATRLLDNEWAAAEGQIYPQFEVVAAADLPAAHIVDRAVAVDPAYASEYAAIYVARTRKGNHLVTGEYSWVFAEQGDRTPAEHARAVIEGASAAPLDGYWPTPRAYLVDPAAAADRAEYTARGCHAPTFAKDVLPEIANLRIQLEKPRYYILSHCTRLIEQLRGYRWDPKVSDREDRPIKEHDHFPDCLRMHCAHYFPVDQAARYL